MAAELILEFEGVTTKEYYAVNEALGVDPDTGEGNWPDGLITHAASPLDDGNLVVTEVSDTPEDQATFMVQRLGGAVVRGGITSPPTAVIGTGLVAHHQLRG